MADFDARPLAGTKVLIVEDEFFIASELARVLSADGAQIIGPVNSVAAAERLIDGDRPDCALLDMNLRGAAGVDLVPRLESEGVRFAVLSGYDRSNLPASVSDAPYLAKPATAESVTGMVAQLTRAAG